MFNAGRINAITTDSLGRIYVGGSFTTLDEVSTSNFAILAGGIFESRIAPTAFLSAMATAGVPANQRGPTDDSDSDGIPNLLEYALGLSPTGSGPGGLPVPSVVAGNLSFSYLRAQPDVLDYVVESTADLSAPNSWTTNGIDQGTPAGDGVTTATIPLGTGPRFLHLRVTFKP